MKLPLTKNWRIWVYILLIFNIIPLSATSTIPCPYSCPYESGRAAVPVIFNFNCIDGEPGDIICIPITVEDFTNIVIIQLEILWDHEILEYVSVGNPGNTPGLNLNSDFNQSGPNTLRVIPLGFPPSGITLPDGATIFEICFRIIGTPGSQSCIDISPYFEFEVVDVNGVVPSMANECCMTVLDATNLVGFLSSCGPAVSGANGTIDVSAFGGTAPYTITWTETTSGTNGGPANIANEGDHVVINVPAGEYDITFTDAAGASIVRSIEVAELGLSFTHVARDPTCYKFNNGTIRIYPTGGVPPYGYIWTNLTDPARAGSGFVRTDGDSSLITSLSEGVYRILVIDSAGCEAEDTIVLTDKPFDIKITNLLQASCQGAEDGVISLMISGGTPDVDGNYRVRLPAGNQVSTNMLSIGLLNPGEYSITINDNVSQCDTVFTFTIGYTDTISAQVNIFNPVCAGATNGSIFLIGMTNGVHVPTYTYRLYQGADLIDEAQNIPGTYSYNALGAGDYYALVSAGSCVSDTIFFSITTPDPIIISIDGLEPDNCLPTGSGDIWFTIENATMPYEIYAGAGFQEGDTIFNLNTGNYVVTVTDFNGCTATLPFYMPTYEDTEREDITFEIDGAPCEGGTITVLYQGQPVPGAVGISWGGNASGIGSTIPIVGEGVYTVELFWPGPVFCVLYDTIHIQCPTTLRLDISVIQPVCGEGADGGPYTGTVIVDTINAVEPVTWYWSFPDTTNSPTYAGLMPGWYYVTVTDGLDSVAIDSFEIIAPPIAQLQFTDIDSVSCLGICDGYVRIFPFGGVDGVDYTIYWGEPANSETGTFFNITDLCGGIQEFSVTQDGVCFYRDSVDIPIPEAVELQLVQTQPVSCYGGNDGMIEVAASGGTPDYSYAWTDGPSTPQYTGLTVGNYTIEVTDSRGCSASGSFEIVQPDTLIAGIDATGTSPLSCSGMDDGAISLAVTGGNTGGYTYQWIPNVSTSNQAINLAGGTYSITVTDPKGCQDTVSWTLATPESIDVDWPEIPPIGCFGEETVLMLGQVTGGSGVYTLSVNGAQTGDVDDPVMLTSGVYVISVSDDGGCATDTTYTITEPGEIILSIQPEDPVINIGDSLYLNGVMLQGDFPMAMSTWSSTIPVSCESCEGTWVFNQQPTVYTWTVTDINGCQGSTSVVVNVNYNRNVYIPNVFSPNGDGRNDEFRIFTGQGVVSVNYIRIFDRWGGLLHSEGSQLPNPTGIYAWDGLSDGKQAPPGVYVYVAEITFVDNITLIYSGDITLIK